MHAPRTHAADIDVDPPEPPDPDEELPPDDGTHGASVPSPVRQNMEPALFFPMSAPHRSPPFAAAATAAASPSTPPPARLLDLPTELLVRAISRCDPADIARVAAVSLLFHASLAVEGIRLWAQERGHELPAPPEGEVCAVRWLCVAALLRESNPPARVAAGEWHSVFIDGEGRLSSCGSEAGAPGLLGHGEGVPRLNTPTRLPSTLGERAVSVSAGHYHSLALTANSSVWSWGAGGGGRLGHGDHQYQWQPKKVEALAGKSVIAVSAGVHHSLALTADGAVWSWGSGFTGELGHGDEQIQLLPKKVEAFTGQRVVAVSAGESHNLALTADGAVWSWGYGPEGRLGHGDWQSQLLPKKVETFAGQRVVAVSAGVEHSLALTADGAVWSWGRGDDGRLGHGDGQRQLLPKKAKALAGRRVVAVSAGGLHNLAITADGAVWSWGFGSFGRLGHGDQQAQRRPKKVEALADQRVVAVSAGHSHSLSITASGAVFTWGKGEYGCLGHGDDLSNQLLPKKIETLVLVEPWKETLVKRAAEPRLLVIGGCGDTYVHHIIQLNSGSSFLNGDFIDPIERYSPVENTWGEEAVLNIGYPARAPLTPRQEASCEIAVAMAVLDGKLYAVGGLYQDNMYGIEVGTCSKEVLRYDFATKLWEAVAPLTTARSVASAVALDGKLYAVGGHDDTHYDNGEHDAFDDGSGDDEDIDYFGERDRSGYLTSVERYDPALNAWEEVSSMVDERDRFSVAVLDGKLYAVGGYGSPCRSWQIQEALSTVYRYDPAMNAWERVAPLTRRASCGVAVLDGKLYAVGGYDGHNGGALSSVERYDPAANAWEEIAPMPTARQNPGVGVLDGKLYVVGGVGDRSELLNTVVQFDPAKNAWEDVAPIATARVAPLVALL